ncbi:MAG: lysylphosphatidylglycerol synthase transmembrane domain-containing protein [Candidatus Poribacteria bacterium]
MDNKVDNKVKIIHISISIVIGVLIVWFLLSKIDLNDIPRAITNIPFYWIVIAFCLYSTSVFFKALRFKIILRSNINFWQISTIVSLYMFFANFLPMRAGELSYMYLLKKKANTSGTKSFASLITGAIADAVIVFVAMILVLWRLRYEITNRSYEISVSDLFSSLIHKILNSKLLIIITILALVLILGIILFKLKNYRERLSKHLSFIKGKIIEVFKELSSVSFDLRLLGIIILSILIISLRFETQWIIVRSMNLEINIWQFLFAILFGVVFSLLPIHGPAGFGTVEAPYVLALTYLNVSSKDAIISGFSLHIIIMLFCIVLGVYGAIGLWTYGLKIKD